MIMLLLASSLITATLSGVPSSNTEAGFGIFGAIGQSSHELVIVHGKIDDSDTSIAFGGEYRFNKNFSANVRYDDFGKMNFRKTNDSSTGAADYSISALSTSVKGSLPLSDQFSIFAKIGFSSWDLDLDVKVTSNTTADSLSGSSSFSGTDYHYGFGGQFSINNNFVIGLEYTVLSAGLSVDSDSDDTSSGDYDISNLSLSLGYNF